MAGNAYSGIWATATTEPKRSHRFLLKVKGLPPFAIKKVSKPSFTVVETPHKFLNWNLWFPGKVDWDPITVTLIDPGDSVTDYDDTSESIMKMLHSSGFMTPNHSSLNKPEDRESSVAKHTAVKALDPAMKIVQLGPTKNLDAGTIDVNGKIIRPGDDDIETWYLHHAWIQKAVFGELNYDNDTFVEINLTIRYDWATFSNDSDPESTAAGNAGPGDNAGAGAGNDPGAAGGTDPQQPPS